MNIGAIFEVEITSLGISGEGIGVKEGLTVFVEGALPLEKVQVRLKELKKNYAIATLLQIIKPSPYRVKPPCPFFERCGGCQIMHLDYPRQLEIKGRRVRDALTRIGQQEVKDPVKVHPSTPHFSYRNKIQLPVAADATGQLQVGLYAKGTHEVIPIDKCLIHMPLGDEVYRQVLKLLQRSSLKPYCERTHDGEFRHLLIRTATFAGQVLIALVTKGAITEELQKVAKQISQIPQVVGVVHHRNARKDNVILDKDFSLLYGTAFMEERLCGLTFHVSIASFFQVNPYQAENLYQKALDLAELTPASRVLDAYCGIGTLSLLIAKRAGFVEGIECVQQAIIDAKENAKRNSINNVNFICGVSEKAIAGINLVDRVFLNPPRKGCDPRVLLEIKRLNPPLVIYISCDPATLARDIQILSGYGFEVEHVEAFDMFPQTMHVETIVKLKKIL
ncbi:MAG: 23S rRNA (uracil(1939)-C(5))-methyltransferase RlmD [Chlamydiae bacterium]|nr:23S rRNA (uracil(1939)-C(5))-methyltransferase RlmD [Chlamydiota bacterium]